MWTKGHWYVGCESVELSDRPLATQLLDQSIVLFRDGEGKAAALLDRCPHRNVPLSTGRLRDGCLECSYHGWRFDGEGACVAVPGRPGQQPSPARATRFATQEQDGYVWVWPSPGQTPTRNPYTLDSVDADHTVIHRTIDYEADLHASVENTIDVPHTAFLHRGLFRSAEPSKPITCNLSREGESVRATYVGEQRPDTWLARLLAPGGGTLEHEDRFELPGVVRVEYRVGSRAHLLSTALFTPMSAQRTRVYATVAYRLNLIPGSWLAPVLRRVAARVLREDAEVLAQQTRNLARFAEPDFASTELDAFSLEILRLLEEAQAGPVDTSVRRTRQVRLLT